MLCYRDMTFCKHSKACSSAKGCHRALTPSVVKEATKLGLGIAVFVETPECFILKERLMSPLQTEGLKLIG